MKKPAGYLIHTQNGLEGEPGFIYDYVLAENGLFLEASSPLLAARICIAPGLVRGLAPQREFILLPHGKIPGRLYELALSILYDNAVRECYLAVTWEDGYRLRMPLQMRQPGDVKYQVLEKTVMDIHSHPDMAAVSSTTDDEDEQGFRLSLIVGHLNKPEPDVRLRLAMYGYYQKLELGEVFES
ncbi:MAG: hypothetical protein PHQ43_15140 [Dehalococcoidales bacterium]|nr:hypothetical protein [Dehalococcoidales bacterium]